MFAARLAECRQFIGVSGMLGEKSSVGISAKRWRTFSRSGLHSVADWDASVWVTYGERHQVKQGKAPVFDLVDGLRTRVPPIRQG